MVVYTEVMTRAVTATMMRSIDLVDEDMVAEVAMGTGIITITVMALGMSMEESVPTNGSRIREMTTEPIYWGDDPGVTIDAWYLVEGEEASGFLVFGAWFD
jgi:hypothetical protein